MRLFPLTILVTLACAILYSARNELRSLVIPNAPPTPPQQTSAAEDAPAIFAAGVVEGLQSPLVLRFENPGKVESIRVRAGESVKAGDVLAELEPDSYELRIARAEAQLRVASAERDQVAGERRNNNDPTQQPRRTGQERPEFSQPAHSATASASSDRIAIADAHLESAVAALKLERLLLEKSRLVAPVDGIILSVRLQKGELVGPLIDTASITMVNRLKTRVRAFVEELDAMEVAVGQSATVVASGTADRKYNGIVLFCSPFVQPKSLRHSNPGERLDVRVREIIVELKDGANLLTGLPVEVFVDRKSPTGRGQHSEKLSHRSATTQTRAPR